MQKPKDWNTMKLEDTGMRLSPGGHIWIIRSVYTSTSKSGKEMLNLEGEINEGTVFDGMFLERFKQDNKWPNQGIYRVVVTDENGNTSRRFRSLITSVTHSNPGFEWNWQEGTLQGKFVGIVYREREYVRNDNTVGTFIEPFYACSVESVHKGISAPEKRTLADQGLTAPVTTDAQSGFQSAVTEDDLPF